MLTIQQVANELGVSTKTLRRWEEAGYLVPERDKNTKVRLYHPYLIEYWKKKLDLDRAIREHLKLLEELKKELDAAPIEQTYIPGKPLRLISAEIIERNRKAHDEIERWNERYKVMINELAKFPSIMNKAIGDKD